MSFLFSPTFHAALLCTILLNAAIAFLAYHAGLQKGFSKCSRFILACLEAAETLATIENEHQTNQNND